MTRNPAQRFDTGIEMRPRALLRSMILVDFGHYPDKIHQDHGRRGCPPRADQRRVRKNVLMSPARRLGRTPAGEAFSEVLTQVPGLTRRFTAAGEAVARPAAEGP